MDGELQTLERTHLLSVKFHFQRFTRLVGKQEILVSHDI